MTFEQDLNTWCLDTQKRLESVEKAIVKLQASQKYSQLMLGADLLAIVGLIITVVFRL